MATRQEFNSCISKGMAGKTFTKEQRKLEFCTLAKLCSGKVRSREEALRICSQPKPPKPARTSRQGRSKTKSCEKRALSLASCIAENWDMEKARNINNIEMLVANALLECDCGQ